VVPTTGRHQDPVGAEPEVPDFVGSGPFELGGALGDAVAVDAGVDVGCPVGWFECPVVALAGAVGETLDRVGFDFCQSVDAALEPA